MSTTITARELAKLLEVPPTTLYRWVQTGRITADRTLTNRLRFDPAAVRADYQRAGVDLPAPFADHIAGRPKPAEKSARREERGAA